MDKKREVLILYYNPDYTKPQELQHVVDFLEDSLDIPILFLPNCWDYEYMTKEETIARLQGMIDFVKGTNNE